MIYAFALLFSCQRVYVAVQAPRIERERRELTESFMEALIPEPSPDNIDKCVLPNPQFPFVNSRVGRVKYIVFSGGLARMSVY